MLYLGCFSKFLEIKSYLGPVAGSEKKVILTLFPSILEDYQEQRMSPYIDVQIFVYFDKEIQDM